MQRVPVRIGAVGICLASWVAAIAGAEEAAPVVDPQCNQMAVPEEPRAQSVPIVEMKP